MRKRIFEIIEISKDGDKLSYFYDLFMMATIMISIAPLMMRKDAAWILSVDSITVSIFILDYIFRLATADFKLGNGSKSFLQYPFTFMAIIDLLCILPSIIPINSGFKILKMFRLVRTFRVLKILKVFKMFRYSKNVKIILDVLRKQKDYLIVVGALAIGYIYVTALVIFNFEPETFESFYDAIYWATISLTTVGYGDIYAVSDLGKFITMISALMGIAIVALPAGIITAGYMDCIKTQEQEEK